MWIILHAQAKLELGLFGKQVSTSLTLASSQNKPIKKDLNNHTNPLKIIQHITSKLIINTLFSNAQCKWNIMIWMNPLYAVF